MVMEALMFVVSGTDALILFFFPSKKVRVECAFASICPVINSTQT